MKKLKNREHDFASKLQQRSTIKALQEYIIWQRAGAKQPQRGPISINLDLTSACNFACPFCVDSAILNTGKLLRLKDIKKIINLLHNKGLRSVILLGGGEPTLHAGFREIVKHIKSKGLELGIVTNGTRLDKVIDVAGVLEKNDWVRISLDAAREETFKLAHHPRTRITLKRILNKAKELKKANLKISLGYSFVIVWDGVKIKRHKLNPNIDEITEAVELAQKHSFDYISFKPCLIRLADSQKESLLHDVNHDVEERIRRKIEPYLKKTRAKVGDKIKILESVNLKALLNKETERIKIQPRKCHLQFFRTVVAPSGIFHCPAFRGVEKARIAASDGYTSPDKFNNTLETLTLSINTFDARKECEVVGCFYNDVNWWIENFINSNQDVNEIEALEDDNFFL